MPFSVTLSSVSPAVQNHTLAQMTTSSKCPSSLPRVRKSSMTEPPTSSERLLEPQQATPGQTSNALNKQGPNYLPQYLMATLGHPILQSDKTPLGPHPPQRIPQQGSCLCVVLRKPTHGNTLQMQPNFSNENSKLQKLCPVHEREDPPVPPFWQKTN